MRSKSCLFHYANCIDSRGRAAFLLKQGAKLVTRRVRKQRDNLNFEGLKNNAMNRRNLLEANEVPEEEKKQEVEE
jgi:hypothetical protein